jgi:2-phosphosulfolactate phosphatase
VTINRLQKRVVIDCLPESLPAYASDYAIVAVDVIRATTTAVTAVAVGRRCFPVETIEAAVTLAARLDNPLLVGELGGSMPYGFDLNNSPAQLAIREDVGRPMILLSTSGTRLMCGGKESQAVYVACLRNYRATAAQLAAYHPAVAIIGAGARGEFREEDQLGCAWIAQLLLDAGYSAENEATIEIIRRWDRAPIESITRGASAEYLRRTGQDRDLDFILSHVDDLDDALVVEANEVVKVGASVSSVDRSVERAVPGPAPESRLPGG